MTNKKRQLSTNEFLNIKDIREKFLYTRDDKVYCYIKVENKNCKLLSDFELENMIIRMASEFSTELKPLFFYFTNRPANTNLLIDDLTRIYEKTSNYKKKEVILNNINETYKITSQGEALEKQSYIGIYELITNDYCEDDLLKRSQELITKLYNQKFNGSVLEEKEIIQMCNSYINSQVSYIEDTSYLNTIPLLKFENAGGEIL